MPSLALLKQQEVADMFGCSANHLRTLPIPTVRFGRLVRYRMDDVLEFVNGGRREGDA